MSGDFYLFIYILFCCHRLGEVTLKDVKAAVDREGNYRYHFKALDPEFGTVKEEVKNKTEDRKTLRNNMKSPGFKAPSDMFILQIQQKLRTF